jgi:apolipoprotein N-acyltransferase
LAAVAVSVAVLLGYGTWRLSQEAFQEGPVIGIAQCSFRNTLTGREKTEQEVLEGHVSLLKELEGKGCDLVVLPETMLPQGLNAEMLNLDINALGATHLRLLAEKFIGPEAWEIQSEEHLRNLLANAIQGGLLGLDLSTFSGPQLRTLAGNFAGREIAGTVPDEILRDRLKTISSLAGLKTANGTPIPGQADYAIQVGRASERLRCPVLAGGVTWHFNDKPTYHGDEWLMRNSAMWFDQSWLCSRLYSKMHLVPFSEYVPFKHSSPWLYRQLRLFVPSVMSQVEPGDKLVRFDLRREAGAWQVATPICYEGTFARVCRAMVRSGPKDRLIVANLSNDGWFVWRSPSGANNPSSEHAQHLASYCFRAVENRVPVVRAVNTGISASIDSNGRIAAVLERYGRREMATGTLLLDGVGRNESKHLSGHGPKVLVDSRISMYSFVGDVFAMLVCAVALWLTAYIVLDRLRSNRAQS